MVRYNPLLLPLFPPMLEVTYMKMSAASVRKPGTGLMKSTAQPDMDTERSLQGWKERGLGGWAEQMHFLTE